MLLRNSALDEHRWRGPVAVTGRARRLLSWGFLFPPPLGLGQKRREAQATVPMSGCGVSVGCLLGSSWVFGNHLTRQLAALSWQWHPLIDSERVGHHLAKDYQYMLSKLKGAS